MDDLNLSAWVSRRKYYVGPYSEYIIKGIKKYEETIRKLRKLDAEYGEIESHIIMSDPHFDGDSDHKNCEERLKASIDRIKNS